MAVALILSSYFFIDRRLAALILRIIGRHILLSPEVSGAPDLLFEYTAVLTVLCWGACLYSRQRPSRIWKFGFFQLAGCSVPLAYFLKFVAKDVIGRTNARVWLQYPSLYGVHWFEGGGDYAGFPSGHMAVFTALLLAVSRFYPRTRQACRGCLVLLAAALILSEHHFLSDVISGAYLGLLVDLFARWGLWLVHGRREADGAQ